MTQTLRIVAYTGAKDNENVVYFGKLVPSRLRLHSVGVDIIEIERVATVFKRHGPRFLRRVYTDREAKYCRGRIPELAVRFAAKEAVMKALGTGIRGVGWREIEILPDRRGKPLVFLHGRAELRALELGLLEFVASLSHARAYAVAFVVASGVGDNLTL